MPAAPSDPAPRRSRRNRLATLGVFLAIAIPQLFLVEMVLRTWLIAPDYKYEDPELGPMNRPHARVVFSKEGWAVHRTNAQGFFSPELREDRPRRRVLLLGSSFTEALQVAPAASFARVAEARLPDTEIVNAAQSGWSPAPAALLLERIEPELRPDLVVLQVSGVNPFTPNLVHVAPDGRGGWRIAPPIAAGEWERRIRLRTDWLASRSALVTMLLQRFNQIRIDQQTRLLAKFGDGSGPAAHVRAGPVLGRRNALEWLLRRIAATNPRVMLLYVATPSYERGRCYAKDEEERAMNRSAAADLGLAFFDPTDALCADYLATGQPLHGFHNAAMGEGHLNARGHQVIGAAFAREIEALVP
jgi:hypothetical protein